MSRDNRIACGMYAFDATLQRAWRELFARFDPLDAEGNALAFDLGFDAVESVAPDRLLFGHSCGYPLMTQLKNSYVPFCVPVFDVPGADGRLYSSRIIVAADSGIESLQQCRGSTAVINTADSNSGMNLLRYELARLGARPGFFAEVRTSGGHLASLQAVASGTARVAAIDCVTFQLIADLYPDLAAAVSSIGFTAQCPGLPFVIPLQRDSAELRANLLTALQQACAAAPPAALEVLHLRAFEAVDLGHYESIMALENYAISKGYAALN